MATGTTEFIDLTTAAVSVPTIWSKRALVARQNALVMAMLANRQYERDAEIGNTIKIQNVSHLTAFQKEVGTDLPSALSGGYTTDSNAAISYETITETDISLTIATWIYSAVAIETAAKRQVNRNMIETYAPEQGYALAVKVDDDLAGLVDDFSNSVGTLGTALTYDDVLRARQYLDDADVPQEDRVIVIAPAQDRFFMQLPEFIHGDYKVLQSDKANRKDRAFIGAWMGVPIYKTVNVEGTNAAGHDNAFMHKDAFALVVQMEPTSHTFMDVDYLAYKAVVEQLYGYRELRDDHGVWMKGA